MPDRRYHIVLNSHSGAAGASGLTAEALQQHCELAGLQASIDGHTDRPLADRIAQALASDAEVIVAAGGDGTATALARAVVDSDKTLGILPLGTANLLARDLDIPLELEEAITGLQTMQPRRIDVGEVNGRIFLHKVVIGFVPGIAAGREQIRGRENLEAEIGFFRYFLRRLARTRRIAVEITPVGGEPRIERVQAVAVANNEYAEGFTRVFSREALDGGNLGLYVLKHLTLRDVIRLTAEMFLGNWRHDEALEIERVRAVIIRSRKRMLKVMMDGEIETLDVPLKFRIRPRVLSVLAPVPPDEPAGDAQQPDAITGT